MGKPVKHGRGWAIRWNDENGVRRSKTFASYSNAQKALNLFQVEVEAIKAGIKQRDPETHTFQELADYWMKHRGSKKRNPKDDQSILRAHLLPFFGKMNLKQINTDKINEFERITSEKVGIKTLHNHLTLLNTILNEGVEIRWITEKPRIKKPKLINEPFKFLRTTNEIQLLLNEARNEKEGTFELFSTAILTGMRAGEIAGLHWADIDFDKRQIQIHRSYTGPTKSGRTRIIPIVNQLLTILREWKLKNPLPIVFPNKVGKMYRESDRVFQEIFQKCLKRAGLERIRFHDLRHTFASHYMMGRGSLYSLRTILGHSTIKMTEHYAHLSPHLFKEDYDRFDIEIGHEKEAKILSINS